MTSRLMEMIGDDRKGYRNINDHRLTDLDNYFDIKLPCEETL